MPRAFASGQIAFGLVNIPVKLFSATEASEKISFNMLHKDCGNRVQQQLFCPKDERTISREEVVKGYEFSRGQYVLFNEEELKMLEEKATQAIEISEFLPKEAIDPIYFAKANYIAPDKGGERAYSLLTKALEQTGRWALAKYAARGKQYLVILRPLGNGIVMQQLFYPNEIRSMDELDLGDTPVKDNELKMAVQLAEMGAADEFHPENYRDEVTERDVRLYHMHIDPRFGEADLDVVLPMRRLAELAGDRIVGAAAARHYSIMGYILEPSVLVEETAPAIAELMSRDRVDAAALVPA